MMMKVKDALSIERLMVLLVLIAPVGLLVSLVKGNADDGFILGLGLVVGIPLALLLMLMMLYFEKALGR